MKLFCNDRFFTDEYGRARLFNGVNIVDKSVTTDDDGNHVYNFDVTDESLEALSQKGMNIIRLGITWAGVQREPDKIEYSYLDGVKAAIEKCRSHGFEVYLDFHQDLFSKYISCGDGAPAFACKMLPSGKPKKCFVIWAEDYFVSPWVHKSFDAFWTAGSYTQEQFMFALKKTAEYLADCDISAYDVFNEPFPGSPAKAVAARLVAAAVSTIGFSKRVDRKKIIKDLEAGEIFRALEVIDDPKVMGAIIGAATPILDVFHREKYMPFLRRAEEALREAGYEGVIFAENSYFSNLGIPCAIEKTSDRMAFAPHGYDITVDTPITNTASPHRVDFIFNEHERTQKRLNVPVLVGEWGGMVPGADEYPALKHLIKKFDKNYWSQTYWHYFRDMENSRIVDTMTRFYPVAVAGTPKGFDNMPGRFSVSYTGNASCGQPTEIFLAKQPKKVYSTLPYTIEGNRLYAEAGDGECVIVIEY